MTGTVELPSHSLPSRRAEPVHTDMLNRSAISQGLELRRTVFLEPKRNTPGWPVEFDRLPEVLEDHSRDGGNVVSFGVRQADPS